MFHLMLTEQMTWNNCHQQHRVLASISSLEVWRHQLSLFTISSRATVFNIISVDSLFHRAATWTDTTCWRRSRLSSDLVFANSYRWMFISVSICVSDRFLQPTGKNTLELKQLDYWLAKMSTDERFLAGVSCSQLCNRSCRMTHQLHKFSFRAGVSACMAMNGDIRRSSLFDSSLIEYEFNFLMAIRM